MRSFKVTDTGLELCDGDRPRPGRGQVAIDVTAIALNRGECRRAVYGGFPSGFVPGWDTAGIISEIGPDTEAPPVGTRVIARALSGGWAECRVARRDDLAIVPDDVELGEAATLVTAGATAMGALTRNGPILGRMVLITGASGSVGRLAVQLARLGGAHVVAAVRTEHDRKALIDLGADEVISDLTEAPSADLIIETLGGKSLVHAVNLLNAGGHIQSLGWSAGEDAVFTGFDGLMKSGGTLQGFAVGEQRVGTLLAQLVPLLQTGKLKTSIQLRRPWDDLLEAAHAILQPGFSGKAVLDLTDIGHRTKKA